MSLEKITRDNLSASEVALLAYIKCNGGEQSAKKRFLYSGVQSCKASHGLAAGEHHCEQSCLGYADCVTACPEKSISMNKNNIPVVDIESCTGCGDCVDICPRNVIILEKATEHYFIACNSNELGTQTKAHCDVGCIACRLCEKACSFDAINIEAYLAVIDANQCTNCSACLPVCPTDTIVF
jgi:Na+-translocating ferredoxin:NAD+ oxidoreductase subunit B